MEKILLNKLAKMLLQRAGKDGMSKVKLAKMLYFVHKGLCQSNLSSTQDMK